MKTKTGIEFEVTEGSVLDELDLPDARIIEMKIRIAVAIQHAVKERKLRQADVAQLTKLSQPNVSALMNTRLQGFSLERLIESASRVGAHVELHISDSAPMNSGRAGDAEPLRQNITDLARQVESMLENQQRLSRMAEDASRLTSGMAALEKQTANFLKLYDRSSKETSSSKAVRTRRPARVGKKVKAA